MPTLPAPDIAREWGTPINTLRVPAGLVQVSYEGDLTRITARADWGHEFAIHEFGSPDEVLAADPTEFPDDTAHYQANANYESAHPECLSDNLTNNNNPDPDSAYWRARNLAAKAKGTNTPLFITQGFIENNTKPEDTEEYLDNHHGVERGWMGQWEHVRGNERNAQGQLLQGRAGFFDERWLLP